MIRSMTGFGQAARSVGAVRLQAEVKSVNHRFAETVFHIPREWAVHEDKLRRVVQRHLRRGRIDVTVTAENSQGTAAPAIAVDWALADAYLAAAAQLRQRYGLEGELELSQWLALPDVLVIDRRLPANEQWEEALLQCVEEAVIRLDDMRTGEGRHLHAFLRERLEALGRLLRRAETAAPRAVEQYRGKLRRKIDELLAGSGAIDENRIAMEVALMAERSDIGEELSRIASHIGQFADLLEDGEPVGRRLDFLIQEMNREANTIGAKAGNADLIEFAVNAKAELEKMREQVQNIE